MLTFQKIEDMAFYYLCYLDIAKGFKLKAERKKTDFKMQQNRKRFSVHPLSNYLKLQFKVLADITNLLIVVIVILEIESRDFFSKIKSQ